MLSALASGLACLLLNASAFTPMLPNILPNAPSPKLQIQLDEAQLQESIEQFGLSGQDLQMCIALDALGELYDSQERFNEGARCQAAALDILAAHYGKHSKEVGYAYGRLSGHYVLASEYASARVANEKGMKLLARLRDVDELKYGVMCHNQAWLETGFSQFKAAEEHYKQCIMLLAKALGDDHVMVALTQSNLAALYAYQNRFVEAEKLYSQCMKTLDNKLPGDPITERIKLKHEIAAKRCAKSAGVSQ